MAEDQGQAPVRHGIPPPYPLAMVICDAIWLDPFTGKRTIIGTFSAIGATEFPMVHPIMSVYAALTDGRGKVQMRLVLVDANEEREPIFSMDSDVEIPDPRAVLEWNATANNLVFPAPGEYRMQLFADGTLLVERRIVILDLSKPEES